MRRRTLLATGLGALGAALLPTRARAAGTVAGRDLNFLFVTCYGGWDPTRVFAPVFGSQSVDMEPDAASATAGGLQYVDHPERPSVRAFMDANYERTMFVNGTIVQAVSHASSLRRLFTGGTSETLSDWPSLLAVAGAGFTAPNLVISGPSYPGVLADVSCRTGSNGQLASLLAGDIIARGDMAASAPSAASEARVSRYLSERSQALLDKATNTQDQALLGSFLNGLTLGEGLKGTRDAVDWSASTFTDQAALAVDVLALGLSRCVTLDYTLNTWDTHSGNDYYQTRNFEGVFAELVLLLDALRATPGRIAATVADETVVVVISEMGRCPLLNPSAGKDHWPYTSAMLSGPNLSTNRVIGGYDSGLYGVPVDLATGDATDSGDDITPQVLGATLLALGDVDPGDALPGIPVLDGALDG